MSRTFRRLPFWETADGSSGNAEAVGLTRDAGYFTFFSPANVELVVKVLNGCGFNSNYWVFASGLFRSIQDTSAFARSGTLSARPGYHLSGGIMSYDHEKADEMTLALMYLSSIREKEGVRAWKTYSWDITDRLFERGWISDPKGKTKSVWLTTEGARLSEELFRKHFGGKDSTVAIKTTE